MVEDPADFDHAFRQAATPTPAVAEAPIEIDAYCARHPEAKMQQVMGSGASQLRRAPAGEQRVTVACPTGCGTTVVLVLRQGGPVATEEAEC